MSRSREAKHRRVAFRQHVGGEMNFDGLAITRTGHKSPARWRAGNKAEQAVLIERRNETICHDPHADAFHKNVAIDWNPGMQVGREHAVIFGFDVAEID